MTFTWLYPLLMLTALVTMSLLLRRFQERLPLTGLEKLGLGIGGFCGAMLGAKLPFILAEWPHVWDMGVWFAHGKTIMCGLVGGYFGVELAKWTMDIRIKTGDTFAAPVAAAVAIGRLACFSAGCCYGAPTTLPWGVRFPTALDAPAAFRHPTQLYEAMFHAMAAILLAWLTKHGYFRGQLIKLYLISYLVYRFLSEFIRPEVRLWGSLTGYQWAALALIPVFMGLWWRDRKAMPAAAPS